VVECRRVALVSGASSDIGFEITKILLENNYQVYAQVYANKAKLDSLSKYNNLFVKTCDLKDHTSAQDLISLVIKEQDKLDVLINLIGPYEKRNLEDISPELWRQDLYFNLDLVYYLSYYAKKYIIKNQGHIINFAFAGAELIKARTEATAYCIAKAGVLVLTKSLAASLGSFGVRVNAISPGIISNGAKNLSVPVEREGQAYEIAELTKWLLENSPAYVTGSNIALSGGWEYI
jgi:3-oxoacyl-[acyl-carrier protein] reductase